MEVGGRKVGATTPEDASSGRRAAVRTATGRARRDASRVGTGRRAAVTTATGRGRRDASRVGVQTASRGTCRQGRHCRRAGSPWRLGF